MQLIRISVRQRNHALIGRPSQALSVIQFTDIRAVNQKVRPLQQRARILPLHEFLVQKACVDNHAHVPLPPDDVNHFRQFLRLQEGFAAADG